MSLWQDETGRKHKPMADAPLFESGLSSNTLPVAQCETGAHEAKPFAPDEAQARRNDPETSKQAAKSVVNLGRTRNNIMRILRSCGPLTDEGIAIKYALLHGTQTWGQEFDSVSPSGLRSRRSELVKLGFVEQAGFSTTAAGRTCQVWRVKK